MVRASVQMRWVHASNVATEMVNGLFVCERTDECLERKSMSPHLLPRVCRHPHVEKTVSVRVQGARPCPTMRAVTNLFLESFDVRRCAWSVRHGSNDTTRHTEFIGRQLLAHLQGVAA